jgi:hypothetical protein
VISSLTHVLFRIMFLKLNLMTINKLCLEVLT